MKPDHIIICVYCGHEYPENTPTHGADVKVLTDHIKECNKHPMSKVVKALQDILDSEARGELHRDPLDTDIYFKAAKQALGQ